MQGSQNQSNNFKVGDRVVYQMSKQSTHPGPRAQEIFPSERGEEYSYVVDKYWIVSEIQNGDQLVLKTRRGKTHVVFASDFRLRIANWWERFFLKDRFPQAEEEVASEELSSRSA